MGVVRRDGDWRLERRQEGVYEMTFRREPRMKVLTSEAPARVRRDDASETVPVRTVSTVSDAEELFEEKAHGPPPRGTSYLKTRRSTNGGVPEPVDADREADLEEVPPLGVGIAFLLAGGLILYSQQGGGNSLVGLLGVGFALTGVLPFAFGIYRLVEDARQSARGLLVTGDGDGDRSSTDDAEETPPAPEELKDRLVSDRAGQHCEWCDERDDHLQVHHIEPRREGGPNESDNLIVLCPNCRENADRGAISRSKLKATVDRREDLPTA